MHAWISPRLGIRFDQSEKELKIYCPDGTPFHSYNEINILLGQERQRVETEKQRAEFEKQRAEFEKQRADDMEALLNQYRAQFGDLNPS